MRKLTLSGAVAMLLIAGGTGTASARNAPWCAWYDAYTYNCGFFTFEQCLATVSGAGGACYRNVYAPVAPEPRRNRRDRS